MLRGVENPLDPPVCGAPADAVQGHAPQAEPPAHPHPDLPPREQG
jgi:hypothetical protein